MFTENRRFTSMETSPWPSSSTSTSMRCSDAAPSLCVCVCGFFVSTDVFVFAHTYLWHQDLSVFSEGRGSEVVYGVADYWVSRVTWNPDDQEYHILGTERHERVSLGFPCFFRWMDGWTLSSGDCFCSTYFTPI